MTSIRPDLAQKATALANRLRLVQADCADETPENRQGILSEEVERALKGLAADEREALLNELGERFPAWDHNVDIAPKSQPAPVSKTDQRELKDPSFLITRLEELAPGMSEADRRAAAERLKRVGMALPGEGGLPDSHAAGILAELGLAPGTKLDAARLLELTSMLLNWTQRTDALAWSTWRKVAPNSDFKRPGAFKSDMARFVSGDQDMPRGQIDDDLERLRKVVAGLLSAAPRVGELFSTQFVDQMAPPAIENAAARGALPVLGDRKDTACWRRYVEMSRGLDSETISRDLLIMWGDAAERLMKAGSR